ncbi:DNA polymerase beta-like protein [Aureobasidium pullulans]|nr:DNA polymerase beta-like protein [Aureobasidium pullulans]
MIAPQTSRDAEAKKKIGFDALYALDNESDEAEDDGLLASLQKVQGKTLGDPTISLSRSRRTPGRPPGSLVRSKSNIIPALSLSTQQHQKPRNTKSPLELLNELSAAAAATSTSNSIVKDTPILQHHNTVTGVPSLEKPADDGKMPPSSALPASSAIPMIKNKKGKGKQVVDIKLAPEDQRIFQGLHFYFFPNSDTHPGRRQRIIKAIEYGASWQDKFNDTVTHIIVDRDYDFEQLLKYLKLKELPAGIVVVNENYTATCMDFYKLVDTSTIEFRVKGYEPPASSATIAQPNPSQASEVSLQLKPVKRKAVVLSSQVTSEASLNLVSSSAASLSNSPAPGVLDPQQVPNKDEDELDTAIRQAKESHPLASDDEDDVEGHKRRKTNN